MTFSEKIITRIQSIMTERNINIIEATSIFCEENDIEPEDFIKNIDKNIIQKLRMAAVENNYVRKKVASRENTLPIQ